ncbi:MAG: ParB/RepB/Spo0J family partition protein [Oligoflexia bacterium]|nr:ParB/RepB/Spo0J family partition protein [Oligoflexia bacterium]
MAKKLVLANNPLLSGPAYEDRTRSGIPYREIQVSAIDTDPNQPRVTFDEEKLRELSESIKTYGVLSPILVRAGKAPSRYTLVAGERRLRAAKMAGLSAVPALINHEADQSGERTLAIQLVENLQRSDLTPLERAHAIAALKETNNLSVRDVADRLGVSKSLVQRSLEILDLPDDLLNALREGASESKVLLLANIEDAELRATYLKDLEALTRSKLKKEIDSKVAKTSIGNEGVFRAEDQRIADEIRRSLGLKVSLVRSSKDSEQGKLTIEFYSDDDLQDVFRRLVSQAQ